MLSRILVLLFAFACPGALARPDLAPARPLRVVLDGDYAPYSFRSANGQAQGLLADEWRAWEKKTGVSVDIEALDWNDALAKILAGEADVIDSIVETPERRQLLDFTESYSAVEASIYFRSDITGIADLASLRGFPVGAKAGDQHIDRLIENGVTTIVRFRNNEEIVQAAREHKISVFVMDDPSAHFLLIRSGIASEFRHSSPIFRDELRRAVRKGDATTLAAVNRGFSAISPAESEALRERWFGRPLGPNQKYLKYAGNSVAVAALLVAILVAWNYALRRGIIMRTAALGESELRLRQITDNIRDVFWITTPDLDKLLYVSPAYESIWGRSAQDAGMPGPAFQSVHPEDSERVAAELNAQRDPGFDIEYRIVRPDNSIRWIRNRGFPVLDKNGQLVRIAGMAQDLTEQRSAAEAARETASQLEYLSRRLVVLQELERKLLARELHDRVGQNLTALSINMSILRSKLPVQASDALRARLLDSESLLESTTASIRSVVTELHPPMLDDQGLALALDWFAGEVSARTGVLVAVHAPDTDERASPEIEIALFRIAQEALNNVVKHACATRVEIVLERSGAEYCMTVEDDGIGFEATGGRPTRHSGLGIVTMRERSQAVGGSFEVHALPGSGTLLTVRVPAT